MITSHKQAVLCLGVLLALGMAVCAPAGVVISEFMAINDGPLTDEDGDNSDWIELQNSGTNTVSLAGWYLTDKLSNLAKWAFPATNLTPGQLLLVFASEKNRRVAGQPLHTNFKLDGAGEYLGLIRPDGTTVEFAYAPTYPQQYSGMSYGATPDANTWFVPAGAQARAFAPLLSIPAGWTDRVGFNDNGWTPVARGIGFQNPIGDFGPYLNSTMSVSRATFCTRYGFTQSDAEVFDVLRLAVRFDDGFVAFLNGVKIAESNAPPSLALSSTSTVSRANAEAVAWTEFDATAFRGALEQGTNVLAIQALNISSTDSDMLLEARLFGAPTNGTVARRYFSTPTPGTMNAAGLAAPAAPPDFSLRAGFYTNAQALVLNATGDGALVRYTLNGDEPTESSAVYSVPLTITSRVGQTNVFSLIATAPSGGQSQWSWMPRWAPPAGDVFKGTVVRARTFAPGRLPSPIVTHTYFVDTNMPARYGHLPVISLTSDRKHLFDPATGIYVPGNTYVGTASSGNYYQRWEKPCNIEWFEPGGEVAFNAVVGIRVQGNTSCASPHKGISVFCRSEYGTSSVTYPIFATAQGRASNGKDYKRFMLRGWGSYRGRGMLYDPFTHVLLDQTDLDAQNYRPCVVFINGEYWGVQELREANKNSQYLEDYYGVDRDDPGYDVLYGSGPYSDFDPDTITDYSYVDEGDGTNWNEMVTFLNSHDMSQPANYAYIQTRIDVDDYILYMVHSGFGVKADWPNQNEAKFRARTPDGRWRWLQFDMDHCFQDSWSTDMMGQVRNHNIFSRLDDNPDFVNAFINRYADLLNTAFRTDVMLARFDAMVAELQPFAPEWHSRWPILEGSGSQIDRWNFWLQQMRANIANRASFERDNVRRTFGLGGNATLTLTVDNPAHGHVRINSTDLDPHTPGVTNSAPFAWQGIYYQGVAMRATAIAADGYQFTGWQGLSTSTTNPVTFSMTGNATLTPTFAPFDPEDFPLAISEVMYHGAPGDGLLQSNEAEFVELHNRGASPLNLSQVTFTEGIAFAFTNSIILPPDGYAVLVNNLATFTARYGANVSVAGVYAGQLDNSGETLRLKATPFGPTLASLTYGDGREWPVTADGAGHSLVPLVPSDATDTHLNHGAFWRASAYRFGSPGMEDPGPVADVVLNELVAHTDLADPTNHPGYDSNDWLELYNATGSAKSLDHWYLSDDPEDLKKWAIPGETAIGAKDWLVLDEIHDFHNPITNGFGLNKAGETVLLSYLPGTGADRVADAVTFKGQENGVALGRYPDGAPAWFPLVPTPGASNGVPITHVIISEIMAEPADDDQGATNEFIELWNPTEAPVTLVGEGGTWRLSGGVSFHFAADITLPPGGYVAVVAFDPTTDTDARQAFLTAYGLTNGQVWVVGPYEGRLSNEGERVSLERPQAPDLPGDGSSWIIVDEVLYAPFAPWPTTVAGTGRSIRRLGASSPGTAADSWIAELFPSPGKAPNKLALASPEPGSQFLVPVSTTATVAIDESQVTGTVHSVEFRLDGTTLTVDESAPFACQVDGLTQAKAYVLEAFMTDDGGTYGSTPATLYGLSLDHDGGATDITETTARLRGRLNGSGTAAATFYWGTSDGGTNAGSWDYALPLGSGIGGSFSRVLSGLTLGQTYYYRVFAANDSSSSWAPQSDTFRSSYASWTNGMRITMRDLTAGSTLSNFPVLVALSTNIPGFSYSSFASATGGDLRFTLSTNSAALAHEIEAWNVNGTSYAWVRVPELGPGPTTLYACWGNAAASLPSSATNGSVWSDGEARVLHVHGSMQDSSTNHVLAVDTGTVAVAGVVGEGRYLDGADDAIDPSLPAAWYGQNIQSLTLSMWVFPSLKQDATAFGALAGPLDSSRLAITQSGGKWKFVVRTSSAANQEHAVDTNRWQMLTLVLDHGQAWAYCNGLASASALAYTTFTPSRLPLLGTMSGQSLASYRLQGRLDEVRVASVARSPDWIRASYLTVASNAMVTAYASGFDAPAGPEDLDGNGLPDAWEITHLGTVGLPDGDPDGDGALNSVEFIAGTDPTNHSDVFRLEIGSTGSATRISFYGISAELAFGQATRFYVLESSTNLSQPSWEGIPNYTNVRGANAVVTVVTNSPPASATPQFYRGRLWVERAPD
ncbi:MAG: DUF2341 domain-containing protein [Lentisphaerae bacterium]|nr:DUF2341 domain-containing protein [Lentisphaerota bacterium]